MNLNDCLNGLFLEPSASESFIRLVSGNLSSQTCDMQVESTNVMTMISKKGQIFSMMVSDNHDQGPVGMTLNLQHSVNRSF